MGISKYVRNIIEDIFQVKVFTILKEDATYATILLNIDIFL